MDVLLVATPGLEKVVYVVDLYGLIFNRKSLSQRISQHSSAGDAIQQAGLACSSVSRNHYLHPFKSLQGLGGMPVGAAGYSSCHLFERFSLFLMIWSQLLGRKSFLPERGLLDGLEAVTS